MNIPLDNLYHWIEGLMPTPTAIYLFHPHGTKNILNLKPMKVYDYLESSFNIPVVMHDQEPLDYNLYTNLTPEQIVQIDLLPPQLAEYKKCVAKYCVDKNLAAVPLIYSSCYDQVVLFHSEKNSNEVKKYQQDNFLTVYYWSHAVIALDWFRFAKTDPRLNYFIEKSKTFLIYCREWSHRREYRLKFLELLLEQNLQNFSQISLLKNCSDGYSYTEHEFVNKDFIVSRPFLLDSITDSNVESSASAQYCPYDFISTKISVVLETVFDDQRIHLTEKILRPIACGHPFILAAGSGSLEYLKSYGFKTFDPWIDESYDKETNSLLRLKKIVESMKKATNLSDHEYFKIKQIAEFNKQHFFSSDFELQIIQELKNNFDLVHKNMQTPRGKNLRLIKNNIKKTHPTQYEFFKKNYNENWRKKLQRMRFRSI